MTVQITALVFEKLIKEVEKKGVKIQKPTLRVIQKGNKEMLDITVTMDTYHSASEMEDVTINIEMGAFNSNLYAKEVE